MALQQDLDGVLRHYDQAANAARNALFENARSRTRTLLGPDDGELRHLTDRIVNGRNELFALRAHVLGGRIAYVTFAAAARARESDLGDAAGVVPARRK